MICSTEAYVPIGITILVVGIVVVGQLIVAHAIGPKPHHGPVKDSAYESGMPIITDTQRRFNVRFYLVAILFLLFDVEIVFMWPWATVFHKVVKSGHGIVLEDGTLVTKEFLAVGMGMFFLLLLFGLAYEWKRGAFEWD